MSDAVARKPSVDNTRLGEFSAMQPLSGVTTINETFTVHGLGRAAYVRIEKNEKGARTH